MFIRSLQENWVEKILSFTGKNFTKKITLILQNIRSRFGRWVGVGGSWPAEGPFKSFFLLLVRGEIIRLMYTLSVALTVFK